MSDLQFIKNRLIDEDKVIDIFEEMGCEFVTVKNGRVEAQLPPKFDSNNRRGVQCRLNDSLTCQIRNRTDFSGGDIFSLISYIVHDKRDEDIQSDLYEAKNYLCKVLGWTEFLKNGEFITKKDYVAPLKAIMKETKRNRQVEPNKVLPEEILENYFPYPYKDWIEEGISFNTQKMYGIGFDLESKRITMPMRDRFGNLIGVKARIVKDEDDDRKYLYLHKFNNSQELFNFHYAHPYILMEKKVYIFEGEKSAMKMFDKGVYNAVSIGSSDISSVQAETLMKCGLDIEIVICFDSDKTTDEIKHVARVFGKREVKAIFDMKGLLGEKESPIDKGLDVFRQLEREYCYPIKSS